MQRYISLTPIDYVQRYDIVFPGQEYVELHLPGVVHLPVVESLLVLEQNCHRMATQGNCSDATSDVHQYDLDRRDDSEPFWKSGTCKLPDGHCICWLWSRCWYVTRTVTEWQPSLAILMQQPSPTNKFTRRPVPELFQKHGGRSLTW